MKQLITLAVLAIPSISVAGQWDFATALSGVRPSAAAGEGVHLSPSPAFTLAGTADMGTEAPIILASATDTSACADGSCSVVGRVANRAGTAVRRVAAVPGRILARRPIRGFLGRVRCGLFGCQ